MSYIINLFVRELPVFDWKYSNVTWLVGLERVLKLLMVVFLMEKDKKL